MNNPDTSHGLLRIQQVANQLGVSVKTIYNWLSAQDGSFPEPIRIPHSNRLYWRQENIDFWLESHASRSQMMILIQKGLSGWSCRIQQGTEELLIARDESFKKVMAKIGQRIKE